LYSRAGKATKSSVAYSKLSKGKISEFSGEYILKTTFLFLLCCLFSLGVYGQTETGSDNADEKIGVEEITLARDDGKGTAGETVTSFFTTDVPIHCSVRLTSSKAVTVKMNFIAVSVPGVKAETKVVTTSFKTNGKQNQVNFTGAPEDFWSAGKYRIEISLDGKLAKSQEFEIQKSPKEAKGEKQTPVKTNPKPRLAKGLRKT
jgi:hypothetical protein